MKQKIGELLAYIYGKESGEETCRNLEKRLSGWMRAVSDPGTRELDQRDAFVITYGDQFAGNGKNALSRLDEFASRYLAGTVSGIHILPFFPYSSDDGFSIIDYREVNTDLGTWDDVTAIGKRFRLMADLVLNHCSVKSSWFQGFLRDDPKYAKFFLTVPGDADVSGVARPRTLPLLTPFDTVSGRKYVWTTFSADQADLDYGNPDVLLEYLDIFFYYLSRGVQVIRLDAVAYVWKELGHSCIHHPKTHAIVKLFRAIIDEYLPWVVLITETNVPHKENFSYFGDGGDEAHMIYQFPLPPLVLDAFLREDTRHLGEWISGLLDSDSRLLYFNFLASHDGVGITPVRGIMSEDEIDGLIGSVKERGGLVSYKATAAGEVPYELNVNYLDAVAEKNLDPDLRARKFLASQAVMLSLRGVPGIYIHSLIGSQNYAEGVAATGMKRTINREKLNLERIIGELEADSSLRKAVYGGYRAMLEARAANPAFHPAGRQRVIDTEPSLLAVERLSPDGDTAVLCLINVSAFRRECTILSEHVDLKRAKVLLTLHPETDSIHVASDSIHANLAPWQVLWIG